MNATEKMILAEQIASVMNAYFIGRPTKEEAEQILRVARDQYQNYLDMRPDCSANVISMVETKR